MVPRETSGLKEKENCFPRDYMFCTGSGCHLISQFLFNRTNTVILVGYDGSVTYVERAMLDHKEPLDTEWSVKTHTFFVESLQEKAENVNDEPSINNNQTKENCSSKRSHQDDPKIGEPMKKKPDNDGRSANEEEGKLIKETPSCTSCGTVEASPALRQKGNEEPSAKGRVVTNGTV